MVENIEREKQSIECQEQIIWGLLMKNPYKNAEISTKIWGQYHKVWESNWGSSKSNGRGHPLDNLAEKMCVTIMLDWFSSDSVQRNRLSCNPGTRDRQNGEISDENQSPWARGESLFYLFRRGWGSDHRKKKTAGFLTSRWRWGKEWKQIVASLYLFDGKLLARPSPGKGRLRQVG